MQSSHSPVRLLLFAGLAGLVSLPAAQAAPWKKEPQPLVAGPLQSLSTRYVVKATPGSNLAFDSSWRILWSVQGNVLDGHIWTSKYFSRLTLDAPANRQVLAGSALVADAGWHVLYFVSPEGRLRVMQKAGASWFATDTVPNHITQVLGVHKDWHTVFAYDADQ